MSVLDRPDYGVGIVGKCLGPTTLRKLMKDGCKIFWTYVSKPITNVLCIVCTKLLIFCTKTSISHYDLTVLYLTWFKYIRKKLLHALLAYFLCGTVPSQICAMAHYCPGARTRLPYLTNLRRNSATHSKNTAMNSATNDVTWTYTGNEKNNASKAQ